MPKKTKSIWQNKWLWMLAIIAIAVAAVHAFLPFWVRDYVNRKLSEIPEYRGHVEAIELYLWRGA